MEGNRITTRENLDGYGATQVPVTIVAAVAVSLPAATYRRNDFILLPLRIGPWLQGVLRGRRRRR